MPRLAEVGTAPCCAEALMYCTAKRQPRVGVIVALWGGRLSMQSLMVDTCMLFWDHALLLRGNTAMSNSPAPCKAPEVLLL